MGRGRGGAGPARRTGFAQAAQRGGRRGRAKEHDEKLMNLRWGWGRGAMSGGAQRAQSPGRPRKMRAGAAALSAPYFSIFLPFFPARRVGAALFCRAPPRPLLAGGRGAAGPRGTRLKRHTRAVCEEKERGVSKRNSRRKLGRGETITNGVDIAKWGLGAGGARARKAAGVPLALLSLLFCPAVCALDFPGGPGGCNLGGPPSNATLRDRETANPGGRTLLADRDRRPSRRHGRRPGADCG